jgi:hypothetical protein
MDPFRMDLIHIDTQSNGRKKRTIVDIETEDIIAIFAGLIAIMFAVAMIAGWVEINKYTVGLAGFSGAGAVIAKIMKARKPAKTSPTPVAHRPKGKKT